ncbi:MAG: tRNA lysidine(34) synthetase TilS, partial [candidate division Zixibacteria bacterium]
VSAYEDLLVEAGKSKIVLDLAKLKDYDKKLRKKIVIEAFRGLNDGYYKPSYDALSRAEKIISGRSGAGSHLGNGIWIEKSKNSVSVFLPGTKRVSVKLRIPGATTIPFSDLLLRSEVLKRSEIKRLKTVPEHALLDNAMIPDGKIRFWKDGDKIRPFGMRGRRLLSDVFSDRGIPSHERTLIPLLIVGDKIAWIAGVMISDDFKVGSKTKDVLSVKLCEQ